MIWVADLRPRPTNSLCILSGWATIYDPDQPIRHVFSLAELQYTTRINQCAMFFHNLSYDLRPTSTNSQCFFSGLAKIYDPNQPFVYVFSVTELQSTTQINHFSMFFQWLSYNLRPGSTNTSCFLSGWTTIYDPDQPIRHVFSVAEQRSMTQINQFAMFVQCLSYDLRPRLTICVCFVSGWAAIYIPD